MKEMILTVIVLIICICYVTQRTIPLLLEWLECMSIDEMTDRRE